MGHPAVPDFSGAAVAAGAQGMAGATLSGDHDLYPEGVRLGLTVATATWLWLVIVDLIAGQPFHIFNALGGVVAFTMMHYLLNLVFGIALVWAVHGAVNENSIAIGLVFASMMIEVAFAFVTALLSNMVLGDLAWFEVFGGSVVAMTVAITILMRGHPLLAQFRRAEVEG